MDLNRRQYLKSAGAVGTLGVGINLAGLASAAPDRTLSIAETVGKTIADRSHGYIDYYVRVRGGTISEVNPEESGDSYNNYTERGIQFGEVSGRVHGLTDTWNVSSEGQIDYAFADGYLGHDKTINAYENELPQLDIELSNPDGNTTGQVDVSVTENKDYTLASSVPYTLSSRGQMRKNADIEPEDFVDSDDGKTARGWVSAGTFFDRWEHDGELTELTARPKGGKLMWDA